MIALMVGPVNDIVEPKETELTFKSSPKAIYDDSLGHVSSSLSSIKPRFVSIFSSHLPLCSALRHTRLRHLLS